MKHLQKFEAEDPRKLLTGLRSLGFEDMQSVFIQTWTGQEESEFSGWILVGRNVDHMIEILLDPDMVSPIPSSLRSYITRSAKEQPFGTVAEVLNFVYNKDEYLCGFRVFDNLRLQPQVNSPMLVAFVANDFYRSISLLETYYTNIAEEMEKQCKVDWFNNLYVQKAK
jgi:hypothetical protein